MVLIELEALLLSAAMHCRGGAGEHVHFLYLIIFGFLTAYKGCDD
jgi:hypothetical protein